MHADKPFTTPASTATSPSWTALTCPYRARSSTHTAQTSSSAALEPPPDILPSSPTFNSSPHLSAPMLTTAFSYAKLYSSLALQLISINAVAFSFSGHQAPHVQMPASEDGVNQNILPKPLQQFPHSFPPAFLPNLNQSFNDVAHARELYKLTARLLLHRIQNLFPLQQHATHLLLPHSHPKQQPQKRHFEI